MQPENNTAAAALSKLLPPHQETPQLLSQTAEVLPSVAANISQEKWFDRQTPGVTTAMDTLCTSNGNKLQNATWHTLVARSGSRDRSARNAQLDKNIFVCVFCYLFADRAMLGTKLDKCM